MASGEVEAEVGGRRVLASSLRSGVVVAFFLGLQWDPATSAQVSEGTACEGMAAALAQGIAPGGGLAAQVRAKAAAAEVPGLERVAVDPLASSVATECTFARVHPPTAQPTLPPIPVPTLPPSPMPTPRPTPSPSPAPSGDPSRAPTPLPTLPPTSRPTASPTAPPSPQPTGSPSTPPTAVPTLAPTPAPSEVPSPAPTTRARGQQKGCLCVSPGIALRLWDWCPEVAPFFPLNPHGESCVKAPLLGSLGGQLPPDLEAGLLNCPVLTTIYAKCRGSSWGLKPGI